MKPMTTTRGLDHVVHAVRDLEASAQRYRRLGFTVGARNRHPWGTHNRVVQLPGFFIELLTVAEPELLGNDGLSTLFGRFNQSFLAGRQGLSLLILESGDVAQDLCTLQSAGIAASDVVRFERSAKRPDGSTVEVAFSLVFARDQRAPSVGFALCQQHFPENFWNSAFQRHANAVRGISGVVLVAEHPADHRAFLSSFSGVDQVQTASDTITASTPRGDITVMDQTAFRARFDAEPPEMSHGARLAAVRFHGGDRAALTAAFNEGGIAFSTAMGATVVMPELAMGATLVFE
jgi:catechol 2,3-dioxygenase-like lactoylglutathione lyase family enzyme